MDDFIQLRPKRRLSIDIPIAPVLDMMVAVIFFLLLSSSFELFTKQTLPPSKVTTAENVEVVPSPSPQLIAYRRGSKLQMVLSWEGSRPGKLSQSVSTADPVRFSKDLYKTALQITKTFKDRYPNESSLRLGFNRDAKYQDLMTVMDGASKVMENIILISYSDASSPPSEI